jgi:hypothetical protein
MMTNQGLTATKICEERALFSPASARGSPYPDGEPPSNNDTGSEQRPKKRKSGTAPSNPDPSDYKLARAVNTARNKELARQIDDSFREKYGGFLPDLEVGASKPARKKREKKKIEEEGSQHSTRNNKGM